MDSAADQVRRVRAEHFGPRRKRPVVDAPVPVLENNEPADELVQQRFAMEMEQGAHRDTLERLIGEKDQTIATLQEHLSDVRARLDVAEAQVAMRELPGTR